LGKSKRIKKNPRFKVVKVVKDGEEKVAAIKEDDAIVGNFLNDWEIIEVSQTSLLKEGFDSLTFEEKRSL